jgi:hypothetical protein
MDVEVVTKLLQDAKALYDVGKFTTLYQDEFFAAMAEQIPPPAPPPTQAPAPAPAGTVDEESDGMESTATVTPVTRKGK